MKKFILIIILVTFGNIVLAQDKIVTHKGDTIVCKVSELTDNSIKYKFEGEDLVNTIYKNLVKEIIFQSGRIQKVTEKIEINGPDDWEKVQITNLETDIAGLTKKGELTANAASGWSTTGEGKMQAKAMEKLKKQAAAIGAHIVLILTTTSKGGTYGISGGTKASVTGVAYGY